MTARSIPVLVPQSLWKLASLRALCFTKAADVPVLGLHLTMRIVWIDGKSAGSTPVRKTIGAGKHKIRFEGPNGKVKTTTVTVHADQEARADAGRPR